MTNQSTPASYIEGVTLDKLERKSAGGDIDPGSQKLIQAEQEYIRHWRKARGDGDEAEESQNLVGLALSGGGIRSATFSLGIMQALANRGVLKRVDYLSTVSGGGYIGSAVTWLLSDPARQESSISQSDDGFGLDRDNFPFGADDPAPETRPVAGENQIRMLKYLRQHGYYLSPGAGISLASLLGVVLRGTLLNLMVWLPVLVLFFIFGLATVGQFAGSTPILSSVLEAVEPRAAGCEQPIPEDIAATPPSAKSVCEMLRSQAVFDAARKNLQYLLGFELFLWITVLIAVSLLIVVVLYSVLTWFRRGATRNHKELWYQARRWVEKIAGILLPVTMLTLLVGILPIIATYLQGWIAAAGSISVLIGMAMAIRFFINSSTSKSSIPTGATASLAAGLFLYGVVLISYQIAYSWFFASPSALSSITLIGLIALPLITGLPVNLNYISVHRYYRDRLMETFMPDIDAALSNKTGEALGADGAALCRVASVQKPHSPYHIINTNLVLVNSKEKKYQDRGGDNFVLSPLYCGSNATGWCSTEEFMNGQMTLPTAVAISAAALNPNTGVGGEGLTRNPFLSLAMSLLNLRIGYWATHPNPEIRGTHAPNHFRPGAYALGNVMGLQKLGLGLTEHRPYLQLSDGGHFENTGVYELVRRRMKLIIVCDGGADPDFSFSDFQTTVRRIEDDFGARIHVDKKASPDQIIPVPKEEASYPKDISFAEQGHMVATLSYADGSEAKLIYLKTTLTEDISFKVKGYAAQHAEFPDESTADQFFDEVQFESYRELGYRIAAKMLDSQVPKQEDDKQPEKTLEQLIREC